MTDERAPQASGAGYGRALPSDVRQPGKKRAKKMLLYLSGMGAEICFACGLILIGYLISLLSGR